MTNDDICQRFRSNADAIGFVSPETLPAPGSGPGVTGGVGGAAGENGFVSSEREAR
jgi:hypothetical protein